MASASIGRAYFIAGRRFAVALEIDGKVRLVHWHEGVLCLKPLPASKLRAPADQPTTLELLADWGLEGSAVLDAFLEERVYRRHEECKRVRSIRRAMGTGLPVRHPSEPRGRFLGEE